MFAKTPAATSYKVPEASGTRKDHVIRRPNEGTRVRRGSVLLACQGIFNVVSLCVFQFCSKSETQNRRLLRGYFWIWRETFLSIV